MKNLLHNLFWASSTAMSWTWGLGLFFSVVCAEDVPFVQPEEVEPATAGTFFGGRQTRALMEVCRDWPRDPLPAGWRDPVRSDKPVLLRPASWTRRPRPPGRGSPAAPWPAPRDTKGTVTEIEYEE